MVCGGVRVGVRASIATLMAVSPDIAVAIAAGAVVVYPGVFMLIMVMPYVPYKVSHARAR
jgi:hypothetical protein